MNQNKSKGEIAFVAFIILVVGFLIITKSPENAVSPNLGAVAYQTAPTFVVASSTAFTLTTTSQRLLASSTPTRRLAATIQPVNCTTGSAVFLRANADVVATANTGIAVYASTTAAFGDYPELPIVQGAVQGIAQTGTCTVLVTEWRSQY